MNILRNIKKSRTYIKKLKIISNWIKYQSKNLKNVITNLNKFFSN